MLETLLKANEVERLIIPIFGEKNITAVVAGQTVILTVDAEWNNKYKEKSVSDELYGILEGTNASSYRFAENKKYEKELDKNSICHNRLPC